MVPDDHPWKILLLNAFIKKLKEESFSAVHAHVHLPVDQMATILLSSLYLLKLIAVFCKFYLPVHCILSEPVLGLIKLVAVHAADLVFMFGSTLINLLM